MFSIFDRPTRLCDGLSRREALRIGGLSTLGLTLPTLLQAAMGTTSRSVSDATFGRAKSVIYVWLQGGPPQHETFDPKPEAPAEIRGPFKPIQTIIPGIHFCELLPRTARIADKLAVVRSMATDSNIHSASAYEVLTGYKYQGPNPRTISPEDWPYFGALVKQLKPADQTAPLSAVWLPDIMRLNENVTPAGQTAGFLGRQWDPDRFLGDPSQPDYRIEGMQPIVTPVRLSNRMTLLDQVESRFNAVHSQGVPKIYNQYQQQAIELLTSGGVQRAFHIGRESKATRQRYGDTKWGQCLLLARRLVESGVRLVHVNWTREAGDSAVDNPMWDTHAQNADRLEDVLCPTFDVGFTALIEDLDQRGLLEDTLVVAIGEFGRTPKINSNGGRDHWGAVFSFAMAGAGITTGQVFGASDKQGGHPARDRVTPADLNATIFHLLGIPYDGMFQDPQGRERQLTLGKPIWEVMGGGIATTARAETTGHIDRLPAYSDALLLRVDFAGANALRPNDFGSRPKGWRASPLLTPTDTTTLGVQLREGQGLDSATRSYAALGFDSSNAGQPHPAGDHSQLILAQEIRNPRAGRYRLRVRATGHASNNETWRWFANDEFTCRMEMVRYRDSVKDPTQRQTLASTSFSPGWSLENAPNLEWFEFEATLDSAGPGLNFSIGNGLGIAIVVEKNSTEPFQVPPASSRRFAHLRIDEVSLDFVSRTINEDVKV